MYIIQMCSFNAMASYNELFRTMDLTYVINSDMQISHLYPDSKVHGANMGPTWVLSAPEAPIIAGINALFLRKYKTWRNTFEGYYWYLQLIVLAVFGAMD